MARCKDIDNDYMDNFWFYNYIFIQSVLSRIQIFCIIAQFLSNKITQPKVWAYKNKQIHYGDNIWSDEHFYINVWLAFRTASVV
jgi:hypothetical protein